MNRRALNLLLLILLTGLIFFNYHFYSNAQKSADITAPQSQIIPPSQLASLIQEIPTPIATATPSIPPKPTVSPTPKPLSFAQMNSLYGPCINLPTLMYHHLEPSDIAHAKNHQNFNVIPEFFKKHLQYLQSHQYSIITMDQLAQYFDQNTPLPSKPILLTFDDGYDDFFTYAYPILQEFRAAATLFIPTGLMNNPGYLTWDQINQMKNNSVLFANHTWSHRSMTASPATDIKEIATADQQLNDKNLNTPKTFAYPYGSSSSAAISELAKEKYLLAFTTVHGSTLCKQKRLDLPRIRIGNAELSSYGL